jgi:hypothetical protein
VHGRKLSPSRRAFLKLRNTTRYNQSGNLFSGGPQLRAEILSGKASKKDEVPQQKLGNVATFCGSPAPLLEVSMPFNVEIYVQEKLRLLSKV